MLWRSRASLLNDGRNEYLRIRGEAVLAINRHDGMHVVWHHDERIDFNVVVMSVQVLQFSLFNAHEGRKQPFAVCNRPDNASASLLANGYEVPTTGAIV